MCADDEFEPPDEAVAAFSNALLVNDRLGDPQVQAAADW